MTVILDITSQKVYFYFCFLLLRTIKRSIKSALDEVFHNNIAVYKNLKGYRNFIRQPFQNH